MAAPTELSLECIRLFMLENGGKVTNHDLVKHFKRFLTDPETRVEARNQFKEYVNTLATIRNDEGEKILVLKKKYRLMDSVVSTPPTSPGPSLDSISLSSMPSTSSLVGTSLESLNVASPTRQPPPYRPPPPPVSPTGPSPLDTANSPRQGLPDNVSPDTPPVPPRRKSSDKLRLDNKENVDTTKRPKTLVGAEAGSGQEKETEPEEQISVKERTQKFNRLASEGELQRVQVSQSRRKTEKNSTDEGEGDGDTSSVTSLDGKAREWLVRAAQGDHMTLTKMAAENPRLARLKVM
ncbi:ankyrin repeat domain-containing protein SOWAHA [Anabrus simplex]|uniref:ankyrin repeat domain-containing protein SOWAHA n=1 Tax=Anabrus simplex TaxID=316456 RepID=UPI0034DD87BF